MNGRIEKRLPTSVPVYLASVEEPRSRERTLTENVSPHGARVISQRFWQSGEESLITPLVCQLRGIALAWALNSRIALLNGTIIRAPSMVELRRSYFPAT